MMIIDHTQQLLDGDALRMDADRRRTAFIPSLDHTNVTQEDFVRADKE